VTGRLSGVGVGPGDPELITLKALRRIEAAAVVAYPAPETGESFARAIAAPHIPAGRTEVAIRMPITPERFPAQAVYDAAAQTLGAHLTAGRDVVVLCEGDPFFYGSFMYLFGRMAGRFPVEVVPGISSMTACAAALGAPLAARDDVLSVIPAPLPDAVLAARLAACDAAAIIKPGRHFARVRAVLDRAGLADRSRYIERATLAEERILPLNAVPERGAPYFSMILVHVRGTAWTV